MRPKLLVLDLDGTVVDRQPVKGSPFCLQESRECSTHGCDKPIVSSSHVLFPRPGLMEFIQLLRSYNVELAVWSSSMRHNVEFMVKSLFGPAAKSMLLFVWSREQTDPDPSGPNPWSTQKNLQKVWQHAPSDRRWSSHNTLMMDDTPSKMVQLQNSFLVATYQHFKHRPIPSDHLAQYVPQILRRFASIDPLSIQPACLRVIGTSLQPPNPVTQLERVDTPDLAPRAQAQDHPVVIHSQSMPALYDHLDRPSASTTQRPGCVLVINQPPCTTVPTIIDTDQQGWSVDVRINVTTDTTGTDCNADAEGTESTGTVVVELVASDNRPTVVAPIIPPQAASATTCGTPRHHNIKSETLEMAQATIPALVAVSDTTTTTSSELRRAHNMQWVDPVVRPDTGVYVSHNGPAWHRPDTKKATHHRKQLPFRTSLSGASTFGCRRSRMHRASEIDVVHIIDLSYQARGRPKRTRPTPKG